MDYDNPSEPSIATAEGAGERATQAWETTKEKSGEALRKSEHYVRENPGSLVVGMFGLGLVLGLVIGWSMAHEERDDYAESARKFVKRWGHKLKA